MERGAAVLLGGAGSNNNDSYPPHQSPITLVLTHKLKQIVPDSFYLMVNLDLVFSRLFLCGNSQGKAGGLTANLEVEGGFQP